MAIKSEVKQWCSTRWPFLTTVSRSNRNLECRIQWRKENHRTWRKPSVTNGLRILSNFGFIFQALHFQYIRFLFIHGQICPYLRFYCLFEDFFNCLIGLRILSNFGFIFQALHFQYIRFLFIHGQLCPYLRFYCLFEDFFNCFSLKTNISFSPSSGGNFRNDYSKYYKALC